MKIYLILIVLLLSINSNAQDNWVKETSKTYTLKHPENWILYPSETDKELTLAGAAPDFFKKSKDFVGTTLYVSSEDSKFSTIAEARVAYKEKLFGMEFLKKVSIEKEEGIKFKGVDAVEIHFKCKVEGIATKCKIIIFIQNEIYYELSVTYDSKLTAELIQEAFKVMETFEFK